MTRRMSRAHTEKGKPSVPLPPLDRSSSHRRRGAVCRSWVTSAEVIMVLGYFAYASLWLGKGLAAAASIPGNIVQGVFGLVAATVVYTVLSRSRAVVKV